MLLNKMLSNTCGVFHSPVFYQLYDIPTVPIQVCSFDIHKVSMQSLVKSGNTGMFAAASAQKKRKCATTERRVLNSTLFQPAFLIPIIPFYLYVGCCERLCKCV